MKKNILLFIALSLVLTACTGASPESDDLSAAMPTITHTNQEMKRKKPRLPDAKLLKASVLQYDQKSETEKLLEEIEKRIEKPSITHDDLNRGWYYGRADEKKVGTPVAWVWQKGEGDLPRWVSPNALDEQEVVAAETLCEATAGSFVVSCVESEAEECEYIPENECRCSEGAGWQEGQGCLLLDAESEEGFVEIDEDELSRGWYSGLPSQKKQNTPAHWVWVDAGQESRWQNPNPLN